VDGEAWVIVEADDGVVDNVGLMTVPALLIDEDCLE
jgi:hypothetical protein